ncbi:MAG: mechanosensitive ion channel [Phycisphaerales bacterium]|jgi:MscS family membrane protein
MLRLALVCVVFAFSQAARGQGPETVPQGEPVASQSATEAAADVLYDSPRSTMMTFLRAVERYRSSQGFSRERALAEDELAKALGLSGPEAVTAVNAAIRLHESLKRMGPVSRYALPGAEELDAAIQRGAPIDRFTYFPYDGSGTVSLGQRGAREVAGEHEISLTRTAEGTWVFSTATVEGSEELFRKISRLPVRWGEESGELTLPLRIEQWVAQRLDGVLPERVLWGKLAGIAAWKWLLIVLIVFTGFLADLLAGLLVRFLWWAFFARRGIEADPKVVRRASRPFALLAGAAVWYAGQFMLGLPPVPEAIIRVAVLSVLTLAAIWAAYRLVDLACDVLAKKAKATATKIDDLLLPLARKTAKVLVTVFGVIYVASALDYEILPLLTGLGIGGLAVAFAAKDTIENFFGSIAVIADRPFEVGDWVVVDDVEGTVEELGIRSTRIRTFYDSVVTVPNATLVRATVDNYGRRRYRRFTTHIGLTYGTPPEAVEAFCEGVRELIRRHPYTRKDTYHVYLNRFGPHSIDVLVYMFHACPDWAVELRERERFLLDVMRVAQRLGVQFAFPTQTLHLLRDEAPAPPEVDGHAGRQGVQAARGVIEGAPWKDERPGRVSFGDPEWSKD